MNSKMNVAILSLLMCIATGGSISFAQYPFHVDSSRYLMLYNTAWSSAGGPEGLWTTFAATSTDGVHWEPALDHQSLLGAAPPSNFGLMEARLEPPAGD